jgi:uncharacterized protein YggE
MKSTALALLTVLLVVPAQLRAQHAEEGLIAVSGEATVQRAPDQAVVHLGVQSEAPEAADAQRGANRIAGAILEGLAELGIDAAAIRTSSLQLYPVYESPPPGSPREEPRVVGYRASNTVSVTLDDLTAIGPAIDRAVEAGANRIDSLELRLEDDSEARREALAGAVREARAKAATIAEALGGRLGAVFDVQEGGVSAPPIAYREVALHHMAMDAPTPVATGNLEISASVTVRYRLADG